MELFETLKLNEFKGKVHYLQVFYELLKSYMKKIPSERITAKEYSNRLTEKLQTIPIEEQKGMVTVAKDYLKNIINSDKRKKDVQLSVEKQETINKKK